MKIKKLAIDHLNSTFATKYDSVSQFDILTIAKYQPEEETFSWLYSDELYC